ncbi:porimin [Choloepus didactylus]|uniref:porimin n=1 Tax=Choloepus didactylus TaxID=27675 RepID=UPI00189D79AA|nr:porimin [Choloepus didactylus]
MSRPRRLRLRPVPPPELGARRPLQALLPRPIWLSGGQATRGEARAAEGDTKLVPGPRGNRSRRQRPQFGSHAASRPSLRTMGLGARGAWAALLLGALQVLALWGTTVDSAADSQGYTNLKNSTLPQKNIANTTGSVIQLPPSHANEMSNSTLKQLTTPVSSTSSNVTAPIAAFNVTSGVSTDTSTTLKSTPSTTGVSRNTSQMTTTHNSSVTSVSSSVTVTATVNSKENKGSKFDIGSFVGGIVLTLGVLSILYIGCKTYYSRRGIRYRTIDEHDAII